MKKPLMSLVLLLLVCMTAVTTGCSKKKLADLKALAKRPKVVAAALITGAVASAHYFSDAFGIKHKKKDGVEECEKECNACDTKKILDLVEDEVVEVFK